MMSRRFDNRMQYGNPRNTPPLPGYRNMRQGNTLPLHHNQGVPYNAPPVQAPYPPNNAAPNPFQNNRPQPFHRSNTPMPPNGGNEQKGGFISKIFRKSKTNNEMPTNPFSLPPNSSRSAATAAATSAASGGLLQSILNPANLTTMLNNTQSVLQAAESITPYVQQYGPMIKNIPAMWKLYRGTQTDDNAPTPTNSPTTSVVIESSPKVMKKSKPITKQQQVESSIQDLQPVRIKPKIKPRIKPSATVIAESSPIPAKTWRKGESKPKLFI